MRNNKIKRMSFISLFIAIEIVISVVPFLGFIPVGPINATTLHIPVLLAATLLGPKEGAILGFVFGLLSILRGTFMPNATSFLFSPFITVGGISGNFNSILLALIPRILFGYLTGLIYNGLKNSKLKELYCIGISSLCGSLLNTILVLLGIYIFFGNEYAQAIGVAYEVLLTFLMGVITTNGLVEAFVATILCIAVGNIAKRIIRL